MIMTLMSSETAQEFRTTETVTNRSADDRLALFLVIKQAAR